MPAAPLRLRRSSQLRLIDSQASRVRAGRTARAFERAASRQERIELGLAGDKARKRPMAAGVSGSPLLSKLVVLVATASALTQASPSAPRAGRASRRIVASISRAVKSARST